jgi:hypothetical protein
MDENDRSHKPAEGRTLADELPYEFNQTFDDVPAYKLRDVKVVYVFDGCSTGWPGTHKHVYNWCVLENGRSVGWNESPSRGWSFPVIKTPQYILDLVQQRIEAQNV